MLLTRIWMFVVGVALAGVLTLALIVPRPALRELEKEEIARLGHVQHAAQLLLKVDARQKMDFVAHLSSDAVLAGALDEASRGSTDKGLHATALGKLKEFNGQRQLSFLCALDAKGRVLAHEGDDVVGDSMAGFPVVADALRGYRGEDAIAIGGRLYRLAASPVLSKNHERYVGALVLGMAAGDELAKRMHESLGADVAFFLKGKALAATTNAGALAKLPAELERRAEEIAKQGRTTAISLDGGPEDRWWAMATPAEGEAAAQDAYYVLLLPRTAGTGLGGFLHAATGDDLKGGFPWLIVVMVALLGVGGSLALLWWESDGPLARLRDEAARLSAGELPKLDERAFRGRFAQITRSINATLDRLVRSGGSIGVTTLSPSAPIAPASSIDSAPTRAMQTETPLPAAYDLPMAAGHAAPMGEARIAAPPMPEIVQAAGLPNFPLASAEDDATTQAEAPSLPVAKPVRGALIDPLPARGMQDGLPALPQLDAIPLESQRPAPSSRPKTPAPARPSTQPPAAPRSAPTAPPATSRPAAAPPSAKVPPPRRPTPFGLPVEELDISPSSGLKTGGLDGIAGSLANAAAGGDFSDSTVVAPPSEDLIKQAARDTAADDLDRYFRKIYQDFVDLKRKCGEPTENVTFEKFVTKLRDNRDQLIKKLGCKSVRFQVYVKDGKAALKASPVRD